MKFGIRKPNLSKRIKARTTGKAKRLIKKSVNPLYNKKGMGYINNPEKAIYNKVYNKTSTSADKVIKFTGNWFIDIFFMFPIMIIYYFYKYFILGIMWIIKKIVNLIKK